MDRTIEILTCDTIASLPTIGKNVEGPMGDSPWGSYAGMFRDKYGIEWIVEFAPQ